MKRNKLWTLFFSLIPGAGQMYQGYMKRGLSLAMLFIAPIMVGAAFMPALTALAAVVYMYSFFDSLNLRGMILDGTEPEDDYLVHLNLMDEDFKKLFTEKNQLIGWGFVLLGVCGLYKSFIEPILYDLVVLIGYDSPLRNAISNALRNIIYSVPGLAIGVAFVAVGLWLVRGGKKENEFVEYKGENHDGTEQ